MATPAEPACRIYAILARDGRSATVFRRGPSRQVLVLRWWFDSDRIEAGQWFRGRIYERRCDLSPNGDLLIYFAAKWSGPIDTWTAVSRTPFLTALVLWPKGDAWGGGGTFESSYTIGLNHFTLDGGVVPGRTSKWHPLGTERSAILPRRYDVCRYSDYAGQGEDSPLHHHLMIRDGWTMIDRGDAGAFSQSEYSWQFTRPEIYDRTCARHGLILRRYLRAIHKKNGPWYVEDFEVRQGDGVPLRRIANCSWADWQSTGDLLFALDGCLYRVAQADAGGATDDPLHKAHRIADLRPMTFKPVVAPDWARRWP